MSKENRLNKQQEIAPLSPCNAQNLLLEEWKQNVALYIDQDRRGLERVKIFLTIHAGLFALYGLLWKPYADFLSLVTGCIICVAGIFFTIITFYMSKRSHAYIIMRKLQAMVIEKELKKLITPNGKWKTSEGIITTFTREHSLFSSKNSESKPQRSEWQSLRDEMDDLAPCTRIADPVMPRDCWRRSMFHLKWLRLLHIAIGILWGFLLVRSLFAYLRDC